MPGPSVWFRINFFKPQDSPCASSVSRCENAELEETEDETSWAAGCMGLVWSNVAPSCWWTFFKHLLMPLPKQIPAQSKQHKKRRPNVAPNALNTLVLIGRANRMSKPTNQKRHDTTNINNQDTKINWQRDIRCSHVGPKQMPHKMGLGLMIRTSSKISFAHVLEKVECEILKRNKIQHCFAMLS